MAAIDKTFSTIYDCLPILMLFVALSNAVFLYNAFLY